MARIKLNIDRGELKKYTDKMDQKPKEVVIKSGNTFKPKLEYKLTDQPLTIKSSSDTEPLIILSDGSRWTKMQKSIYHNDFTVGAGVKVTVPKKLGLKSQGAWDIAIPDKPGCHDFWYFDRYVKK